jgi:hypothetical protein
MVVKFIPRSENPDKWKIRFGEDDSDTRDNRKGRKANVTTLSPKLAIVNVYELHNKRSSRLAAKKAAQGIKKKGTGQKAPRQPKQKKVINPGSYGYRLDPYQEVNGEMLNVLGNPVTIAGEDRKTYNRRVADWRRKKGLPVNVTPEETPTSTKPTQEEEAAAAEQQTFREDLKQQKEDAARKLKEKQAKEPRYILGALVRKYKINTESGIKRFETPKDKGGVKEEYSQRNPLDPSDAVKIEKAIMNGIKEKRIPQPKGQPPAIVAIQTTTAEPPKWYYVRNDLSESRKRKMMRVKAKRPMKSIPHGNKRRVVMKRKGGKR